MSIFGMFSFQKKEQQSLLISLLIDLSAILLWRGTWGLLDLYVFPGKSVLSFGASALLGLTLLMILRKRVLKS